jgi:hypothetical protein
VQIATLERTDDFDSGVHGAGGAVAGGQPLAGRAVSIFTSARRPTATSPSETRDMLIEAGARSSPLVELSEICWTHATSR